VATFARTAGLGVAILLLAGCGGGSSSKPPPPGGVTSGGWQVISQGRHQAAATVARVSAIATDPLRLRLKVDAHPNVKTQTTYQVQCGDKTVNGAPIGGRTPLTRELTVPTGGGSQGAHGIYCSVFASATKPAGTDMIVTLLERPAPVKT